MNKRVLKRRISASLRWPAAGASIPILHIKIKLAKILVKKMKVKNFTLLFGPDECVAAEDHLSDKKFQYMPALANEDLQRDSPRPQNIVTRMAVYLLGVFFTPP